MIQLAIAFAVSFLIVIYPVMLAARMVGAQRTGFLAVVFAILLQGIFGVLIRLFIDDPLLLGVVAVAVGSMVYAFALQTTILRGFAICLLTLAIVVGMVLLLSGAFTILKI